MTFDFSRDYTSLKQIKIGDFIRYNHGNGTQTCIVVSIDYDFHRISKFFPNYSYCYRINTNTGMFFTIGQSHVNLNRSTLISIDNEGRGLI